MLSLLLFLNLFLHVIYFSYFKIDSSNYIFRLTIISLLYSIADTIHNMCLLTPAYSMTLFDKCLRLNNIVFTQQTFLL
jgi:hypothetical protein